jgi:hypothetical protein
MGKLILPVAPFEKREHYVRGGVGSTVVYGINEEGLGYVYEELDVKETEFGMTVRYIPTLMQLISDDYGVFGQIKTSWKKVLVAPTGKVIKADYPSVQQDTGLPDLINFSAMFGIPMMPSIAQGKIIALDGYDEQPLFDKQNQRIPDSTYDTTLGPTHGYYNRQPLREADEVQDTPSEEQV